MKFVGQSFSRLNIRPLQLHLNRRLSLARPRLSRRQLPERSALPGIGVLLLGILLLVSCTSSGGDPAKVVADYLQAKASADQKTMQGLLCSSMEADLDREASSFAGLDAKVQGMTCTRQGDTNVVACTGKIVATYGAEQTDFPLVSYKVVQEDGAWKWCGEASSP